MRTSEAMPPFLRVTHAVPLSKSMSDQLSAKTSPSLSPVNNRKRSSRPNSASILSAAWIIPASVFVT